MRWFTARLAFRKGASQQGRELSTSSISHTLGPCWLHVHSVLKESMLHDALSTKPWCCQWRELVEDPP